jgi:hypothetical protein
MRPLITRRHTLAGLVLTSLAGGRAARADEPKRLIGVIEEDPPFFQLRHFQLRRRRALLQRAYTPQSRRQDRR